MAWANIKKAPLMKSQRRDTPDDFWQKCTSCFEIIYVKDFNANQNVCTKCQHHFSIAPLDRLHHFLDEGSFQVQDDLLKSLDPLKFEAKKRYGDQIIASMKKVGRHEAIVCGEGLLVGLPVQVGCFDFRFMGGSMGSVVGEKIRRVFARANDKRQPAILFSASGGARMQEGILSLMQMAKTCGALGELKDQGVPFISILTHPTTGGVAASFALLGDVNIAEPGALIGFAGPRVIQQTIGQTLPAGFQRSEYLLEHGMLDMICHRASLRTKVSEVLNLLVQRPSEHAEA